MKTCTTGVAAKMLGLKRPDGSWDARRIARMIDKGELDGHLKPVTWQRRTHRLVPVRAIIAYMIKNNTPPYGLVGDMYAQKLFLERQIAIFADSFKKSESYGDLFLKAGSTADKALQRFVTILQNLGSLENISGITRNTAWSKVFRRAADIIDCHTAMCRANSEKN